MIAGDQRKCSELLDLVIDGQATKEQEVALLQHIDRCEKCKKEFELNKSITSSLKSRLKKLRTPRDLTEAIQSKIIQVAS